MDRSTPGFPVHHQLPELAQTHVHRILIFPILNLNALNKKKKKCMHFFSNLSPNKEDNQQ